jgi:ABC-2 type transport system permease protein
MLRIWWTTVCSEALKYSRMRPVLILLIGMPLMLILLLGSAFNMTIKPAKVALFVEDQGELGSGVTEFWQSTDMASYVTVLDAASEQEVQAEVTQGAADYGVYVPADFSKRIQAGEQAVWHTYAGRFGEKNMAAEALVSSYMAQLNVDLAARRVLGAIPSPGSMADHSGEELLKIGTLGNGENQVFGKTSSMQYYSASYLIMFLMYGGMSAAMALLGQKEDGTLGRLYSLPASFYAIVLGIVSGAIVLAFGQAAVIIGFTKVVYGVAWGGQPGWLALICLLTTLAGAALAIVVASFAKTRKTTQTIFSILTIVMTFLSGGMVAGIQNTNRSTSELTINHWASEALRAIMGGADAGAFGKDVVVLSAIAAGLLVVAVIRIPKVVKQHG